MLITTFEHLTSLVPVIHVVSLSTTQGDSTVDTSSPVNNGEEDNHKLKTLRCAYPLFPTSLSGNCCFNSLLCTQSALDPARTISYSVAEKREPVALQPAQGIVCLTVLSWFELLLVCPE